MGSPLLAPLPVILIKNREGGGGIGLKLIWSVIIAQVPELGGKDKSFRRISSLTSRKNVTVVTIVLYIMHDQMQFFMLLTNYNKNYVFTYLANIQDFIPAIENEGKKAPLSIGSN